MAIRQLLRYGDPKLLSKSEIIEFPLDNEIKNLIKDLKDTMIHHNGAGIAAPQIGVFKRIIYFGFEENPRYPEANEISETVLINPTWQPLSEKKEDGIEGCLSVPGMRGVVERFYKIEFKGFLITGEIIERKVEGFYARLIQHEVDHLDGILYPMQIKDLSKFGFEEEINKRFS